jgi:acyl-CoA synthetase (AMP-forming)/AMP-acid ligase II
LTDLQPQLLASLAQTFPEGVAWRNLGDGSALTIGEWHAQSNRLARGLRAVGLGDGDRVALAITEDEPFAWLIGYMAIHKASMVAVPLNTRLSAYEMTRLLGHARAAGLLVSHGLLADRPELADAVEHIIDTRDDWKDALRQDDADIDLVIALDDVADIMYTSGTTGEPKGVVIRHGGLSSNDRVPTQWYGLGFITSSPFTTTSGSLLICGPMRGGLSGWFLPHFDPGEWMRTVAAERPVAAFLVPAMVQLIVAHSDFELADLSSLSVVNIGSAPIASETLRRFGSRLTKADVTCGYGMTEFGAVTSMPMGDGGAHLGSVGRVLPGVSVRIVDDDGVPLPAGEVGQVAISGKRPPRTYLNEAGAPASSADEWLMSGDLGFLDQDAFLWIVGRLKEVIIRGGHNIMPGEVEAMLFEHHDVYDAAVAGLPHEVLGEDVAAWVVLRPGATVTAEDLRAFLLTRLADYKVPRRITLVEALPRNAAGKVLKAELIATDKQGA